MRELMRKQTVLTALWGGLFVSLLCVPFVVVMTPLNPPSPLRTLRLAFLAPVSILAFQVALAWTARTGGPGMLHWALRPGEWALLLGLGAGLAAFSCLVVDRILAVVFPDYFPGSVREVLLTLPWMGVFQPLVFVAAVYAFATRLVRRTAAAAAAVVLVHLGILWLQLPTGLAHGRQAQLFLLTGTYALILALAYRRYGIVGPVTIALLSYARHLLRFW